MTNDTRNSYMAQLVEAEMVRQRTQQASLHEDADPRAGYVARLADAWKEPPSEGDVVLQVGDGGGTIAEGLAKARLSRAKVVVAKVDDGDGGDPREQWLGRLITGWKN